MMRHAKSSAEALVELEAEQAWTDGLAQREPEVPLSCDWVAEDKSTDSITSAETIDDEGSEADQRIKGRWGRGKNR